MRLALFIFFNVNLWPGVGVVADLQEDLLEGCHGDAVSLNVEKAQIKVEICEEVLEKNGVFTWDLNGHFTLNLSQFHDIWT